MNHFPMFMVGVEVFTAFALMIAPPEITVPKEAKLYVPVPVVVANPAPKSATHFKVNPAPAWKRQTGKHNLEFTGPPGKYTITGIYVEIDKDGAPTIAELEAAVDIIGDSPPPGPGPGPNPDALVVSLTGALAVETHTSKIAIFKEMAKFYRNAAELATHKRLDGVYTHATYGSLFTAMQQDATARGISGLLPLVRTVTTKFLNENLPTKDAGTLPLNHEATAAVLNRLAAAMEAVK